MMQNKCIRALACAHARQRLYKRLWTNKGRKSESGRERNAIYTNLYEFITNKHMLNVCCVYVVCRSCELR